MIDKMNNEEALMGQLGIFDAVLAKAQVSQFGMFQRALEIMLPKRHDYSSGVDPLANLRECELIDVAATVGVAIRLLDKKARLTALSTEEARVKDESVMDTVVDVINYACIFGLLYMEQRPELMQDFINRGMFRLEKQIHSVLEEVKQMADLEEE